MNFRFLFKHLMVFCLVVNFLNHTPPEQHGRDHFADSASKLTDSSWNASDWFASVPSSWDDLLTPVAVIQLYHHRHHLFFLFILVMILLYSHLQFTQLSVETHRKRAMILCIMISLLWTAACVFHLLPYSQSLLLSFLTRWMEKYQLIHDFKHEIFSPIKLDKFTLHPPDTNQRPSSPDTNQGPSSTYTFYRYLKEDVVFECLQSITVTDNEVPLLLWAELWKNGVLVDSNDRVYVKITKTPVNETYSPGRTYLVRIKFTIYLIESSDYGAYTCHPIFYVFKLSCLSISVEECNSQKKEIMLIKTVFPSDSWNNMSILTEFPSDSWNNTSILAEVPSDIRSMLAKVPLDIRSIQTEVSLDFWNNVTVLTKGSLDIMNRALCMMYRLPPKLYNVYISVSNISEFILRPYPEKTIQIDLRPGNIMIYRWHYITVAQETDLYFGITMYEDKHKSKCCLPRLKLYNDITGFGYTIGFNYSRIDHNIASNYSRQSLYHFLGVQCVCQSSFGVKEFTLKRSFYNRTLKKRVQINVTFPIKLQLKPTFPDQSININTDCWNSTFSLSNCASYFEMYTTCFIFSHERKYVEKFTYILISLLVFVSVTGHFTFSGVNLISYKRFIVFASASSNTCIAITAGPQETDNSWKTDDKKENDKTTNYDIFLSFDEDENLDLAVAQLIKETLLLWGLRVFDYTTDILPGRLSLAETSDAIERSNRYIIIASTAYLENPHKIMELDIIQRITGCQKSKSKDRVLIVSLSSTNQARLKCFPELTLSSSIDGTVTLDHIKKTCLEVWARNLQLGFIAVCSIHFFYSFMKIYFYLVLAFVLVRVIQTHAETSL